TIHKETRYRGGLIPMCPAINERQVFLGEGESDKVFSRGSDLVSFQQTLHAPTPPIKKKPKTHQEMIPNGFKEEAITSEVPSQYSAIAKRGNIK
ncbi:MAG: hypothetical protein V3S74_05415, partial [Alphaproteobacteria bacterium]